MLCLPWKHDWTVTYRELVDAGRGADKLAATIAVEQRKECQKCKKLVLKRKYV